MFLKRTEIDILKVLLPVYARCVQNKIKKLCAPSPNIDFKPLPLSHAASEFALAPDGLKIYLKDDYLSCPDGGTVDAEDLKSFDRKIVRVRIPLRAPRSKAIFVVSRSYAPKV